MSIDLPPTNRPEANLPPTEIQGETNPDPSDAAEPAPTGERLSGVHEANEVESTPITRADGRFDKQPFAESEFMRRNIVGYDTTDEPAGERTPDTAAVTEEAAEDTPHHDNENHPAVTSGLQQHLEELDLNDPDADERLAAAATAREAAVAPEREPAPSIEATETEPKGRLRRLYDSLKESETVTKLHTHLVLNPRVKKQEKKEARLKESYDGYDNRLQFLEKTRQQLIDQVNAIQEFEVPAKAIAADLKKIDQQMAMVEKQIAATGSKRTEALRALETQQTVTEGVAEKRDVVLEKLIGGYEKELEPFELSLEGHKRSLEEHEVQVAAMEAVHEEKRARIDALKERRIEAHLQAKRAGLSPAATSEQLKLFDKTIITAQTELRKAEAKMQRKGADIKLLIATANEEAEPWRKKKAVFVQMRDNRLDTSVTESTSTAETGSTSEPAAAASETGPAGPNLEDLVTSWSAFVEENEIESKRGTVEAIDVTAFTDQGGWFNKLKPDQAITPEQFKRMLLGYYRSKGNDISDAERVYERFTNWSKEQEKEAEETKSKKKKQPKKKIKKKKKKKGKKRKK